jgi:ring-1,2-phenylacetyl-CoA epoxidase subunit PaaB
MPGDTQLPRYQVFLQEKAGGPYEDVGSVHAADPEMALQNARDVFVRRPETHSLWVAPAEAIYSRTAQELEVEERTGVEPGTEPSTGERESSEKRYYVFCKARSAGTQTLVGEVQASSPGAALEQARGAFPARRSPFAWWVLPASQVFASRAEDVESMFAPAFTKPFRLATEFHTLTAMRTIKAGKFNPRVTED